MSFQIQETKEFEQVCMCSRSVCIGVIKGLLHSCKNEAIPEMVRPGTGLTRVTKA